MSSFINWRMDGTSWPRRNVPFYANIPSVLFLNAGVHLSMKIGSLGWFYYPIGCAGIAVALGLTVMAFGERPAPIVDAPTAQQCAQFADKYAATTDSNLPAPTSDENKTD